MRCDVAIVGAGISGLACAAALSARGIEVIVFEAGERVGGRVRTYRPPDGGPPLELGAQVIHGDRNPLRDLAASGLALRKALPSHPVSREAAARVLLGGRIMPLGALARGGVPPWTAEQKLTADGGGDPGEVTVAGWLGRQGITGWHLTAAAEWFRQNWAADPGVLSARGVAAARCGDQVGPGEYTFGGGYQSLVEALAEMVSAVRLGQPVRTLAWAPGRVELTAGTAGPDRVTARAAVITVPPWLVGDGRLADGGRPARDRPVGDQLVIAPMPAGKAAAAAALPAGDGLCAVAVMSRAAPESAVVFDADGRAGFVRCAAGRAEVLIVAKAGAAAVVRAAAGQGGQRDEGGLAGLAGLVARVLPWSAGAEVTDVRVADWGHDRWSAGAFSYPSAGACRAAAAWAAPVQRTLFFAGEAATAGSLPPSVHGALGSGLRAAHEVAEACGL